MFYVYEWYVCETDEIFYVGKGTKNRYKCKQHNKLFKDYITKYNCKSRIIQYFSNELEAFNFEKLSIYNLKELGLCKCNIRKGGYGGETLSWDSKKRNHYSENNVMKRLEQRERMSIYNPMKNKEIAERVGIKHRKPFYIGDVEYQTLQEASITYNKPIQTIKYWLKVKHNSRGEICYYKYGNQQPSTNLNVL